MVEADPVGDRVPGQHAPGATICARGDGLLQGVGEDRDRAAGTDVVDREPTDRRRAARQGEALAERAPEVAPGIGQAHNLPVARQGCAIRARTRLARRRGRGLRRRDPACARRRVRGKSSQSRGWREHGFRRRSPSTCPSTSDYASGPRSSNPACGISAPLLISRWTGLSSWWFVQSL